MPRHHTLVSMASLCLAVLAPSQEAAPASGRSHWAYRKPQRPPLPETAAHPVDAFVRARLAAAGLQPSRRADKAALLRRVSLDLTGLPPRLDELEAFLRDDSKDAYEKVVDRLLASPRYGEHQARPWLDLARYADSNGFQADQLRDSWAYRDWVIRALNADMPFDRFTIEQLAGDLLPDPTPAQRIATGFHRSVTCNVEAGVHPEANRVNQVVDRVNTTATVWLGSTIACAQCHDHKYDPFSQKEYFELYAFFNQTPVEVRNPNGDKGVRYDFYGPRMELPLSPEQGQRRRGLQARIQALEAARRAGREELGKARRAWVARARLALARPGRWQVLEVADFSSTGGEEHEVLADASILVSGNLPSTTTYTLRTTAVPAGATAFRLETLTHESLPGTGPGRGDAKRPNFILSEFEVARLGPGPDQRQPLALHSAAADYSQARWAVAQAIDGDPRKGWAIGGGFGEDHHAVFQTRTPVTLQEGEVLEFILDQNYGRGRTIGRLRLAAFVGDPLLLDLPPAVRAALRAERPDKAQRRIIAAHFDRRHSQTAALDKRIRALKAQLAKIKPRTTLVMVEQDEKRSTHLMRRGDYLRPGEQVRAATPAVLHAWREDWPKNRLGLARWLVDEDNPLVARVTVNRWWARIFGVGLVSTEEDFGTRAAKPSHPALLDWLAVELMASGWSRKHILKLIVTSATYQQDSRRTHDRDPQNALLSRGPRFRMSAEMIRDNALAVSGLLSTKAFGPPVYPPQPAGLWRQAGRNEPKYVVDRDEDRFRRGIYVVWRRAAPYPSFVLFDGPDRAECHPKRSRTNTPMQALALMNDEAYVEMALALAQRVLVDGGATRAARLRHAFRRVLMRAPTAAEAAHLDAVLDREQRRLRRNPAAVDRLLDGIRGVPVEAGLDRVQLASWFYVATILLNLDETISKA